MKRVLVFAFSAEGENTDIIMICIKIQTDYSERVETGGVSHIHYWNILGVLSRSCLCV